VATELDRLVIKIVGDATQYLSALKQVSDETARAADRIANQSNIVARFFSSITNQAQGAANALAALGSGNSATTCGGWPTSTGRYWRTGSSRS
jgi:Flp pilus assembly protein TadG